MNVAEQAFAEQLHGAARQEPGFVAALRVAGRDAFLKTGLPTLKHEDWRYTNLAALAAQPWTRAGVAQAGPGSLPSAPRLVFVNGRLDLSATDLSGIAAGVRAGSLAATLRDRPAMLEPILGRIGPSSAHAFAALNAALFEDGALVEIDEGVSCPAPIQLVFLSSGAAPVATHPRNLIVAGRGAQATIVESYRGDGGYLVNAVTELALGEGARIEHDRIQEDAPRAFHVGTLTARQGASSHLVGQSIALGAQLARVESRVVLASDGAVCDLHGTYVAGGKQLLDHFVHVDHASPHCTSRQLYKGILDGSSRGVFAGRVLVREGAQKTDAGQINSNLLLSDDATIDTKPQLEILADDVKCSHGGSVGQIREDALFYLRSRGVGEALARAMLTWAFASEMVDRVGPAEVRARVRRALTARLPSGELLQEVA